MPRATGHPAPIARFDLMRRVRRLYRRLSRSTDFDVVHQLNPVEPGVSLALAGGRAPVVLGPLWPDWPPSVDAPTGASVSPVAMRVKRLLRAAQQRRATTVLLSTPAAASQLAQPPKPGLYIRELSPGIDERAWVPSAGGGNGQDVLFLANLEVRKGIHVALDAFELLVRELPEARLLVGGFGAEIDTIRRRIHDTPALRRVELLGRVDRDRVMATMHSCDVFCVPSHGEPFGMTALEAMACARPVVATDAGGVGHLVSEEGGRKVPVGDAAALAGALEEVLADPALGQAMGRHNRRVVEERYTWSRVVDRLEDLYLEALREPLS